MMNNFGIRFDLIKIARRNLTFNIQKYAYVVLQVLARIQVYLFGFFMYKAMANVDCILRRLPPAH